MKPITFSCRAVLPLTPEQIAAQILDLTRWPEFTGYGPLPGIARADFETQTSEVVGDRIRVRNTDGSQHVEEVVVWEPDRRVRLELKEFSKPLAWLATRFVETWEFTRCLDGTAAVRSFEIHPKSVASRPVLWLISRLLKRAVARHLSGLRGDASPASA